MSVGMLDRLDPEKFVDIDIDGQDLRDNWLEVVSEWAKKPPFYVRDGQGNIRAVCGRYADVMEIEQDDGKRFGMNPPESALTTQFDLFMGMPTLNSFDGPTHKRLRQLITPSFGPATLVVMEDKITHIIDTMLDEMESTVDETGTVEIMSSFCNSLMARVILNTMIGFEKDQLESFFNMNNSLVMLTELEPGEGFPPEYVVAFERARGAVRKLVEKRRGCPGQDTISELLARRVGGARLSTDEIIANIFSVSAGALTTTSAATGAALYNLCRHPQQLAELRANPSLMSGAVEECLRYQSAGFFGFPRFVQYDTVLGGTELLAGMPIDFSPAAANFAPELFDDPLTFNIHRKTQRINTFGSGQHLCLGFRIARVVMRIALERIFDRYPDFDLADKDFVPTYHGMHGELSATAIPFRLRR